jgi:SAM-dependent methyltransferase
VHRRVAAAGYEEPGFAARYDAARPSPPPALRELVPPLTGGPLRRVVDLGAGTGLSTRFWAEHAGEVIGVEPSAEMRQWATTSTISPNVRYVAGSGEAIPLETGSADLVTAAQSLQWMDPDSTLPEIGRVLRPGGVLCAYEYVQLQTPLWEPEAAWARVREAVARLHAERAAADVASRWPGGPTERITASGLLDHVREMALASVEHGDGGRLLSFALSEGSIQTLLATGTTEEDLGLPELRRVAAGMPDLPWWIGYRVWLARRAPAPAS